MILAQEAGFFHPVFPHFPAFSCIFLCFLVFFAVLLPFMRFFMRSIMYFTDSNAVFSFCVNKMGLMVLQIRSKIVRKKF